MSQPPPARNLIKIIFQNFINSLKPRQFVGTLKGTDYYGNRYYEILPNPSIGKRKGNRWFVPVEKENFEQELPAEWEAWLRGRRKEPPAEEELMKNLAIMEMKKKNAVLVDAKAGQKTLSTKGMETFPERKDYELVPGKKSLDSK